MFQSSKIVAFKLLLCPNAFYSLFRWISNKYFGWLINHPLRFDWMDGGLMVPIDTPTSELSNGYLFWAKVCDEFQVLKSSCLEKRSD